MWNEAKYLISMMLGRERSDWQYSTENIDHGYNLHSNSVSIYKFVGKLRSLREFQ
jgi:hypothetical protein